MTLVMIQNLFANFSTTFRVFRNGLGMFCCFLCGLQQGGGEWFSLQETFYKYDEGVKFKENLSITGKNLEGHSLAELLRSCRFPCRGHLGWPHKEPLSGLVLGQTPTTLAPTCYANAAHSPPVLHTKAFWFRILAHPSLSSTIVLLCGKGLLVMKSHGIFFTIRWNLNIKSLAVDL